MSKLINYKGRLLAYAGRLLIYEKIVNFLSNTLQLPWSASKSTDSVGYEDRELQSGTYLQTNATGVGLTIAGLDPTLHYIEPLKLGGNVGTITLDTLSFDTATPYSSFRVRNLIGDAIINEFIITNGTGQYFVDTVSNTVAQFFGNYAGIRNKSTEYRSFPDEFGYTAASSMFADSGLTKPYTDGDIIPNDPLNDGFCLGWNASGQVPLQYSGRAKYPLNAETPVFKLVANNIIYTDVTDFSTLNGLSITSLELKTKTRLVSSGIDNFLFNIATASGSIVLYDEIAGGVLCEFGANTYRSTDYGTVQHFETGVTIEPFISYTANTLKFGYKKNGVVIVEFTEAVTPIIIGAVNNSFINGYGSNDDLFYNTELIVNNIQIGKWINQGQTYTTNLVTWSMVNVGGTVVEPFTETVADGETWYYYQGFSVWTKLNEANKISIKDDNGADVEDYTADGYSISETYNAGYIGIHPDVPYTYNFGDSAQIDEVTYDLYSNGNSLSFNDIKAFDEPAISFTEANGGVSDLKVYNRTADNIPIPEGYKLAPNGGSELAGIFANGTIAASAEGVTNTGGKDFTTILSISSIATSNLTLVYDIWGDSTGLLLRSVSSGEYLEVFVRAVDSTQAYAQITYPTKILSIQYNYDTQIVAIKVDDEDFAYYSLSNNSPIELDSREVRFISLGDSCTISHCIFYNRALSIEEIENIHCDDCYNLPVDPAFIYKFGTPDGKMHDLVTGDSYTITSPPTDYITKAPATNYLPYEYGSDIWYKAGETHEYITVPHKIDDTTLVDLVAYGYTNTKSNTAFENVIFENGDLNYNISPSDNKAKHIDYNNVFFDETGTAKSLSYTEVDAINEDYFSADNSVAGEISDATLAGTYSLIPDYKMNIAEIPVVKLNSNQYFQTDSSDFIIEQVNYLKIKHEFRFDTFVVGNAFRQIQDTSGSRQTFITCNMPNDTKIEVYVIIAGNLITPTFQERIIGGDYTTSMLFKDNYVCIDVETRTTDAIVTITNTVIGYSRETTVPFTSYTPITSDYLLCGEAGRRNNGVFISTLMQQNTQKASYTSVTGRGVINTVAGSECTTLGTPETSTEIIPVNPYSETRPDLVDLNGELWYNSGGVPDYLFASYSNNGDRIVDYTSEGYTMIKGIPTGTTSIHNHVPYQYSLDIIDQLAYDTDIQRVLIDEDGIAIHYTYAELTALLAVPYIDITQNGDTNTIDFKLVL